MSTYTKPLPVIDERTRPFWEGAKAGKLVLQQCRDCGHCRFPPSPLCPRCHGDQSAWVPTSGRGTLWSFTIFHKCYFPSFAEAMPYHVAIVELEEGPKLYTNILGVANADLKIGMPVAVAYDAVTPEVTLVKFKPRG